MFVYVEWTCFLILYACYQELCGHLLRASFDLKEQFIQTHGFHVVAFCLSNLVSASAPFALQPQQSKGYYLTEELITQTIHLVVSLGPDAKKGDAITAALQVTF
jgi:hypothetical protein